MNVPKTAIATTLAFVGLFSSAADARISGDQVGSMTKDFLAQATQGKDEGFKQCVNENFVINRPGEKPPLLQSFTDKMALAISYGLVDDTKTFAIAANDLLKQACGDSQLAGGGKKSK